MPSDGATGYSQTRCMALRPVLSSTVLSEQQSTTEYNATLTDGTRLKVTHPFLKFAGKEYVLTGQYVRCGQLFLQCVDDVERKIVTMPASFTDYYHLCSDNNKMDTPSKDVHFTLETLSEANDLLMNALKMSTE